MNHITDPENEPQEPLEVQDTQEAIINRLPTDEPPPEAFLLDYGKLRNLYGRLNLGAKGKGTGIRKLQNYTIGISTIVAWRDFVRTFTGKPVTRGGGVSSPLVELAMRTLMGVIADFELEEVASELKKVLNEHVPVVENIRKLAQLILDAETDA